MIVVIIIANYVYPNIFKKTLFILREAYHAKNVKLIYKYPSYKYYLFEISLKNIIGKEKLEHYSSKLIEQ